MTTKLTRALLMGCLTVGARALAQEPDPRVPPPADPPAATDSSALTRAPVLKHFVEATYPEAALARGVEAVVTLELDVDEKGQVEQVRVLSQEMTEPGFDFATPAREAASQFQFEPTEAGGEPVAVQITYTYRFQLPALGAAEGVVVDRASGKPIAGAQVVATAILEGKQVGKVVKTSPEGRFHFEGLPAGKWQLVAGATGYQTRQRTLQVEARSVARARLELDTVSDNAYDILVEEKHEEDLKGRVFEDPSTVVRSVPRVSRTAVVLGGGFRGFRGGRGGRGGPPGGGFGNRPPGGPPPGGGTPPPGGFPPGGFRREGGRPPGAQGVAFTSGADIVTAVTDANGLVLRGLDPSTTQLTFDGIEVPLVMHVGNLRPLLPASLIGEVDYFTGSFPAGIGRANGGAIALVSNPEPVKRLGASIDANPADMGAELQVPLARNMSLRLGGQLSYLDRTLKALIPADQNVSLSALPRYWDGQAQWSYQPSSALAISATAMTSSDKLIDWFGSAEGVTPGTIKLNNSFWRGVVNTTWKPNEAVTAKLVLGGGIDRYAQPSFDLQVRKFQARPEVTWAAMKSLSFDLGGEYLVERMQGSLADASALPLDATLTTPATVGPHTFHAVGTFLSAVWQPSEGLSILPGLRVEHYSHTHELTADPRVMVRYELLKGQPGIESLVAKAGVGSFHRPPSQLQTDSQIGNPALESEAATHYLLGVEYRPTRQLLVDIAGFYVDRQNVIVSSSQRVTRNDVSVPEVFSNTGTGQTRGVEVFARQELWKNLDGWLSYTFAVSDLTSTTGGTALLSPFDQTHVLVAALAYRLPEGWKLTTRWQYASGNPTTAITGSIFDSSTNQYLPISGPTMGARMPDYHQMDLRIDKTWDLKQARLTTYLDVRNVYNRANLVEPLTYVYDYSAQKGRTGLPVLPLLGIRAEY